MSAWPLDFQISSLWVSQHPVGARAWLHLLAAFPWAWAPLPVFLIQVALWLVCHCGGARGLPHSEPQHLRLPHSPPQPARRPPPLSRVCPSPAPGTFRLPHPSCSSPKAVRGRQLLGTAFIKEPHCPPQASSAALVHTP